MFFDFLSEHDAKNWRDDLNTLVQSAGYWMHKRKSAFFHTQWSILDYWMDSYRFNLPFEYYQHVCRDIDASNSFSWLSKLILDWFLIDFNWFLIKNQFFSKIDFWKIFNFWKFSEIIISAKNALEIDLWRISTWQDVHLKAEAWLHNFIAIASKSGTI